LENIKFNFLYFNFSSSLKFLRIVESEGWQIFLSFAKKKYYFAKRILMTCSEIELSFSHKFITQHSSSHHSRMYEAWMSFILCVFVHRRERERNGWWRGGLMSRVLFNLLVIHFNVLSSSSSCMKWERNALWVIFPSSSSFVITFRSFDNDWLQRDQTRKFLIKSSLHEITWQKKWRRGGRGLKRNFPWASEAELKSFLLLFPAHSSL
jgi:hypothetical protein